MIAVRKIADLEISAASGVVQDGPSVYVVADDELFLDGYAIASGQRTSQIALFPGDLPEEHAARKRAKPDLESLAWLPGGRLVALGSGSTARREIAVALRAGLGIDAPPTDPRRIDLGPLYAALRERFAALNIEGAAAAGPWLRLLQRGGAISPNAVIDLDLAGVLARIDAGSPLGADLVVAVRPVTLDALDGVPLGFTDASPLGDGSARIAFVAAAEDTDNPYDDGPCAGSVLGLLDEEGRVVRVDRVDGPYKLEGVAAARSGLLLVADPDDRAHRAPLLEAAWPWG